MVNKLYAHGAPAILKTNDGVTHRMDLREAIEQALEKHTASLPDEDKNLLGKRQGTLTRSIMATYHYTCQHGGPGMRHFFWKAVYTPTFGDIGHVRLHGLTNIDGWGPIHHYESNFGAFWYHSFCDQRTDRICHYSFRGWTEGEVTTTGISLVLIRVSHDPAALPSVEEFCMLLDHNPGPLPAGTSPCVTYKAHDATSCIMNNIDLHVW